MGRWSILKLSAALVVSGALYLSAAQDPLVDLKAGAGLYAARQIPAAITTLESLTSRLPLLDDYVAWFLGSSYHDTRNFAKAVKAFEPVWTRKPVSPLAARALLLASSDYLELNDAPSAVNLLRQNYALLPQPAGDALLAKALEKAGDAATAATYHQRVYYGFPVSAEAATAEVELNRLRLLLADKFPAVAPKAMLDRALKLLAAFQTGRARVELQKVEPQLTGADLELARVRIGVTLYNAGAVEGKAYLTNLELTSPEADAERIYYLVQYARRRGLRDEMNQMLDRFAKQRPASPWRLKILQALAEPRSLQILQDTLEPEYRACAEAFPKDPQAAQCHWRWTWVHYLQRKPDAFEMLRAHLRQYPASEEGASALYFLGRASEGQGNAGAARAYYEEGTRQYPNLYFGVLARNRLDGVGSAAAAPATVQFLKSIAFPPRGQSRDFLPNATAKARIDRARMLNSAGLVTWAEGELRYAAENEDQPHVIGTELAAMLSATRPDQALRYTKRYMPAMNYVAVESAPEEFWKLAYPMAYRADVERFAKQYGVDPYLAAALIRQESEFDKGAVSRSSARGLMQIMPSTGLDLSRRLRLIPYSTPRLFEPLVNLRMGTYYLGMLMGQTDQTAEYALAAYNAGLGRVHTWQAWAQFKEPAEFVLTIPIPETRGYVQAVLRNADVYRRVWGGKPQVARR